MEITSPKHHICSVIADPLSRTVEHMLRFRKPSLPIVPSCEKTSFLVVVLTPFPSETRRLLEQAIEHGMRKTEPNHIQKHNPLYIFPPPMTGGSQREDDMITEGCSADIYRIALNARDRGWDQFMVIDPEFKFKLTKTLGYSGETLPRAIVVATSAPQSRPTPETNWIIPSHEPNGIIIRRMLFSEALRVLAGNTVTRLRPVYDARQLAGLRDFRNAGIALLDPYAPPLTSEADAIASNLSKKTQILGALSLNGPALPVELKLKIVEEFVRAEESYAQEMPVEPTWSDINGDIAVPVNIQVLCKLADEVLSTMGREVNAAAAEIDARLTIQLRPWPLSQPCTRSNLIRLYIKSGLSMLVCFDPNQWQQNKKLLSIRHYWRGTCVIRSLNVLEMSRHQVYLPNVSSKILV